MSTSNQQSNNNQRYEYELTPRQKTTYESILDDFESWLRECGRKPKEEKPLADDTVDNYLSRVDKYYRLIWNEVGYVSYLSHDHADTVATMLNNDEIRKANGESYAEATKRREMDSLSKYFYWLHDERGEKLWECEVDFDERTYNIPDYFSRAERQQLRDAVLEYGSVPAYNDLTPDERDRWKTHIAQKLGKPKSDVSPRDWEYLNTNYKWVSLLWTALDAGLRPCEVKRARMSWLRLSKEALFIPKEESSKNRDHWEIALRSETVDALRKWKRQRKNIAKYDDTESIWLNREGNPYDSKTLNYFLNKLLDEIDLDDENRNLKWYALRHSTGTYLETKMGLSATANQLRHKHLQTTRRYTHTPVEYRQAGLESI